MRMSLSAAADIASNAIYHVTIMHTLSCEVKKKQQYASYLHISPSKVIATCHEHTKIWYPIRSVISPFNMFLKNRCFAHYVLQNIIVLSAYHHFLCSSSTLRQMSPQCHKSLDSLIICNVWLLQSLLDLTIPEICKFLVLFVSWQ